MIEEDKLVDLGIQRSYKRTFFHPEDRFTGEGQTVLVWCLKDFVKNRCYSEDALAQQLRAKQQMELRKKRAKARSGR